MDVYQLYKVCHRVNTKDGYEKMVTFVDGLDVENSELKNDDDYDINMESIDKYLDVMVDELKKKYAEKMEMISVLMNDRENCQKKIDCIYDKIKENNGIVKEVVGK